MPDTLKKCPQYQTKFEGIITSPIATGNIPSLQGKEGLSE